MSTTIDRRRPAQGDDWWGDLDAAVQDCLAVGVATRPEEIARAVGLSPDGVVSVLAMLAREGKVRITLVEPTGVGTAAAA